MTVPLSLVAGFIVGLASFRTVPRPLGVGAELTREGLPLHVEEAAESATTEAKVERLVAASRQQGSRIERENAMYLAIEAFTAEDFHRFFADAAARKAVAEKIRGVDLPTSRLLASGLTARWLEVDQETVQSRASRLLELIPAEGAIRVVILDVLAAKRREEFLALVPSCKNAAERGEIISRGLRELAAHEPAKAGAWLDDCSEPADRRVAEKAMRLGAVQADPRRGVELAGAVDNREESHELLRAAAATAAKMGTGVLRQLATTPMKPWMLSPILEQLAEHDPELAVDLAVKGGDADESNATFGMRCAFSALALRDPQQATAKLEGLSGRALAAAVTTIGYAWAGYEPAAALAWLAERPPSERIDPNHSSGGTHDVLLTAFSDWAENEPAAARAWVDALPAGKERDAMQTEFARSLAQTGDPAEAARVLASLGHAGDPKAAAEIAKIWARRDPQTAADWAIAQESGPIQSRALAGIVGTWANDNLPAVENWLKQFPPGEARDRSVAAFLWRNNPQTSGATERIAEIDAWFGLIDDPWQRALFARSAFWQRAERDLAGARAWLVALPNVDAEMIRMTLRDKRN